MCYENNVHILLMLRASKVSWFVMLILQTTNQASGHYIMYNYSGEKNWNQLHSSPWWACFTELWPKSLRRKKDFIPFFDFHSNEEVLSSCQKAVDTASCGLKDHSLLALSEILRYLVSVALRINDHSSDFKASCSVGLIVLIAPLLKVNN